MELLDTLAMKMIEYDGADSHRIQHTTKVHAYAALIAAGEGLDEHTRLIVETAAYVHDIGIKPADKKYGKHDGPLQEQEGIAPARALLTELGYAPADVERVCFLVAHHHTLTGVDGIDWRILLEADYLVNCHEQGWSKEQALKARETFYETATGKKILNTMFGLNAE